MLWTSPLTVGLALLALVWTLPEAAGRPYRGRRKRTAPSGWEASGEGSRLALTPGDLRSQLGLRPAPALDDDQISFSDRISSMMV
ncbi:hypothetical protein FJT64_022300 [Amphibalanus amphitrite]|uniref:Uncharacterized protein n=1 Tax=Amphibalanus amphitrite TaxID=1232801 RepID=A0A6A4WV18_AMPAM|nr:hypothetical protein FJT64_022300 [Amphibalanus amphitrite]